MALLADLMNSPLSFGGEFSASPMSFADGQLHVTGHTTKGPSAVADGEILQEDLAEIKESWGESRPGRCYVYRKYLGSHSSHTILPMSTTPPVEDTGLDFAECVGITRVPEFFGGL